MSTIEILTLALQTQPAEISRRVAIRFAELALPVWEARHPTDLRPRRAIEAAKAYRADPCEENLTRLFVCVDEAVMASRVDEYRYDCSARAIATTTWAVSPDCKRPWDSARAALSDLRVAEVPEAGLIKVLKEENRD